MYSVDVVDIWVGFWTRRGISEVMFMHTSCCSLWCVFKNVVSFVVQTQVLIKHRIWSCLTLLALYPKSSQTMDDDSFWGNSSSPSSPGVWIQFSLPAPCCTYSTVITVLRTAAATSRTFLHRLLLLLVHPAAALQWQLKPHQSPLVAGWFRKCSFLCKFLMCTDF